MEFLGIGPSELFFIVLIALILLGPRDMQKAGRTIGKWMRRIVTSDGWRMFQQTSREIQTLPNRLMREAALDELREVQKDLRQAVTVNGAPAAGPAAQSGEPVAPGSATASENSIMPPAAAPSTPSSPSGGKDENA